MCSAQEQDSSKLDRAAAVGLAVELANEQCREDYGSAPFGESDYSIGIDSTGRWLWGEHHSLISSGHWAVVSFDSVGHNHDVRVGFTADNLERGNKALDNTDARMRGK